MKKTTVVLAILFSQLSFAITFFVKVSNDNNAPTPASIVVESLLSPPPLVYTLQAFNFATPSSVDYLIKTRAVGNLKTIMDNNPNWERAELQQYLALTYTNGADVSAIQTSLDNDTYIDIAY